MRSEERFAAMERFKKGDSTAWIFLLSTRAGGLGINLSSADTCVFIDSGKTACLRRFSCVIFSQAD